MGFNVVSTGVRVMDLCMPADYSGDEKYPGVAVTHTGMELIGANIRVFNKSDEEAFSSVIYIGNVDIGAYTKSSVVQLDNDAVQVVPNGNYLIETTEYTDKIKSILEDWFESKCDGKAIPSAIISYNKRSTALNDEVLGYIHGIMSLTDGNKYEVVGKQLGYVYENEFVGKTGGPNKYAMPIIRTYANRLVLHKYESKVIERTEFKKDPNDIIRERGIKEFCWFSKFYE